ncbi:MAG TPA: citrate/2-methylcitrate synthase [Jiangellaceae bacterium]|nr:citrate/2-methylcitrate synthase [Jiangellaceae bacterium]
MTRLTTQEVARRLGVKPETVYAYVSRGLLTSERGPGGRSSTFDPKQVDTLAARQRRGGGEVVRTGITLIDDGRYYYRGVDAIELARRYSYETVAEWLWTGELVPAARFTAPDDAVHTARTAIDALPPHSALMDKLRVAVVAAAVADPLRFELADVVVTATARSMIATLVESLPVLGRNIPTGASLAERLWPRLTATERTEPAIRCLDAALVLLIDHDLAASTLAARVAASARAHPYAVVSAGLGALEGPLHGAASGLAHRMLAESLDHGSAAPVVADHLRAGRRIPGLGHRIYQSEDPRATLLFSLLEQIPGSQPALRMAHDVIATVSRQRRLPANVDLALAALSVATAMPPDAGEVIFAVARTAGWVAHALEEYAERPLRMRPIGQYTGPLPPQPLPEPV